jgi:hypothetical protein
MAAMATGTHSRILAERDRAPVNALLIGIDRMRHRNLCRDKKPASLWHLAQVSARFLRATVESASLEAFTAWMGRGRTGIGRVGVAVFRGLPVDAGFEGLHFLGMTLRALSGNQLFRSVVSSCTLP